MPKWDFNKVALQFIETKLRHRRSPVNLLHIFRTPFYKNTTGGLLQKNRIIGFVYKVFHRLNFGIRKP